ncbi:MAG: septal ring lytic transglycosylase RlpA family protein [Hyphomonadaceae bacterium]
MNRNTSDTRPSLRTLLVASISIAALGYSSMPAYAAKRTPAPIVYAGQGGSTSTTSTRSRRAQSPRPSSTRTATQPRSTAATATSASATPGKRVEFRYPDQPDRFYGAGGARSAADAPPLSFSSSETAISESAARQYANTAPAPLDKPAPAASSDPAITAGGFDARAAAARYEQAAVQQPVTAPTLQTAPIPAVSPFVSSAGVADFSAEQIVPVQAQQIDTANEVPVSGAVQTPAANPVYDQTGVASVFDADLNGQPTANGEVLDLDAMIAAHPTLPLPSLVQVINLDNNSEIVVRVNDRGPFDNNGLIELSPRAANVVGVRGGQAANVRVRYLGPAPVAQTVTPVSNTQQAPAQTAPNTERPPLAPFPKVTPELAGGRPAAIAPRTAQYNGQQTAPQTGEFYVQLGSFSNIGNAQALHTKVAATSNVEITPVRVNGADYFRVMAGPVGNRNDADLLRSYIANQGIADGMVVTAK